MPLQGLHVTLTELPSNGVSNEEEESGVMIQDVEPSTVPSTRILNKAWSLISPMLNLIGRL